MRTAGTFGISSTSAAAHGLMKFAAAHYSELGQDCVFSRAFSIADASPLDPLRRGEALRDGNQQVFSPGLIAG
jgi:hypothetical protein